ncbi:MAG TPA: AAA family ATPase [Terracidiphilus sp.]|nr:AAA family ATPase [Terracidiphilus sp.]
MPFLKSLRFDGLLSFPPGSEAIELTPLNVLIGPNGSGKSNLIEGVELLHSLPIGFASAIRDGGGVREWHWNGHYSRGTVGLGACVDLNFDMPPLGLRKYLTDIRYRLAFTASGQRVEVTDEAIENAEKTDKAARDVFFYYRFQSGNPVINVSEPLGGKRSERHLERQSLTPDESVLSQRKDPVSYPELTDLGTQLARIQSFREWSFGRYSQLRQPQPADLPSDAMLPDARNLGLVLNQLEHSGAWSEFNRYLSRFLPRFQRFSTLIAGGTVQFFLHEDRVIKPIPATRLSDGTIRFMAILAQLLSPSPPPLICMEEPELGLHPDAIVLLADLLQEASKRTQLIVTTHSDALVSALTEVADSVLVCEYRNGTICQRIDSSKLRFWLDKYRLGEIWRIGEIGGNL